MAEFLTRHQFEALKSHSYKAEGRSFLEEHVLRHAWDYLIRFVPLGWAPNSMTLTGVIFMVVPFAFLLAATPDAKHDDIPSWCLFAMAFGLFVFQTLDNLDGRQARRTSSCNALGEFFDHGCDTISDACMTLSYVAACRVGLSLDFFFLLGLSVPFPDYCFFWRAHWSGKYVFGDFDISEVQWILMCVLVTAGLTDKTGALFTYSVFNLVEVRTILITGYFLVCVYYLGDVWYDAVKIGILQKGGDPEASRNVLAPLRPLLLNIGITIGARYAAPGVFETYPLAFLAVYAVVVSKLSCRLLIANMTKTRMVTLDSSMFSFAFLVLSNRAFAPEFAAMSPSAALLVSGAFASADFTKYTMSISSQLADFLNIYCLSLKKRPSKRQEKTT